jgi:hypothetical protein
MGWPLMGFPPPSGGGVASVFTRTGAVTAAAGDYTAIASGSVGIYNPAVASASAIAITGPGTYLVTGTITINTVTGAASGCVITLVASGQAAGVCVVLNNATTANALNLRDNANLGIYANESVTFVYNGTYWIEVARALKVVIDYVPIVSSVNFTATSEATANTVVTSSAITYDGSTPINILFATPRVDLPSTAVAFLALYDGASSIGIACTLSAASGNAFATTFNRRLAPSAGSHTYSARAYVTVSGTGTVFAGTGGAASQIPAFIQISRSI